MIKFRFFYFYFQVAIGFQNGLIKVYNESFALLNSFQAHTNAINRIKQSAYNSEYVATICGGDSTVKIWNIWNISNWSLIKNYANHTQPVLGLEWINEDSIASGSNDKTIKIWSIKTGQTKITINTGNIIYSLKLLSNGFHLACGLQNGYIKIYDINNNGSLISTLVGHLYNNGVNDLILLSNDLLASSSGDKTIRIWNLTTNSTKFILQGHTQKVNGLKLVSSDILASGSSDNLIKLWNITNGQLIRNLTGHTDQILNSVDFLSNSQKLVSGVCGGDQTIKTWNITTGQFLTTFYTGLNIYTLTVLNSIGRASKIFFFLYYNGFLNFKRKQTKRKKKDFY